MTEFEEDLDFEDEYEEEDDGDYAARQELEELRAQVEARARDDAINREIRALERSHGSGFSQEEVDAIGGLIDSGYAPADAYAAVAPPTIEEQDAEAEYHEDVEWLERQQNRALSEPELERVWQATLHDDEEIELHDLDSRQGRTQYAAERYAEMFERPETPEVVERPADDASREEIRAYMEARLGGAEDSDSLTATGSEAGVDYE
jgi:hypothetical protein